VEAWHAFRAVVGNPARPWLRVQRHEGPQAVQSAYAQLLSGQSDPASGHILSLR
jgi:hypothetical protein